MQTMGEGDPLKHGLIARFSPSELKFLVAIMARVAGDPQSSRRRHADAIFDGLRKAGVPFRSDDNMTGNIRCLDTKET